MARLFDFDLTLVECAMHGDEDTFCILFKQLYAKFDQIMRRLGQLCPDWSTEHRERVLDLFIHDRFLKIITNPPKNGIADFNALCWKMLWSSITDAYRFYRAGKRSVLLEVSGDAIGYGEDGLSTFWDAHSVEFLPFQEQLNDIGSRERISDLMRQVNDHLSLMSKRKRQVIKMSLLGYSEREIAERLGMTIGNVGSVKSRVIDDLRKKLCKNHD